MPPIAARPTSSQPDADHGQSAPAREAAALRRAWPRRRAGRRRRSSTTTSRAARMPSDMRHRALPPRSARSSAGPPAGRAPPAPSARRWRTPRPPKAALPASRPHCGRSGTRRPCDSRAISLKARFGGTVTALLEDEDRNAAQTELAGLFGQVVDALLHGVADIDQRIDLAARRLLQRMREHLADLGVAAAAVDARHQLLQRIGVGDESRRPAFAEPAKIDQLDAERRRPCRRRRTSRPAARRPDPRSAGGSSWRRAPGSAGRPPCRRGASALAWRTKASISPASRIAALPGALAAPTGTGVFLSLIASRCGAARRACKPALRRRRAGQSRAGRVRPVRAAVSAAFRQALPALAEIGRRIGRLQVAPALEGAARLPVGPHHHRVEHEMAARMPSPSVNGRISSSRWRHCTLPLMTQ